MTDVVATVVAGVAMMTTAMVATIPTVTVAATTIVPIVTTAGITGMTMDIVESTAMLPATTGTVAMTAATTVAAIMTVMLTLRAIVKDHLLETRTPAAPTRMTGTLAGRLADVSGPIVKVG